MPRETPTIDLLRIALHEAVVERFEADVAVGTFLSGGLDSSIVSALAAQHQPNVSTFSVGFKAFGYLDESEYALQVAQHIKSRHTAFEMTPDDLIEHTERFLKHLDEPFADASSIAVSFLAENTREHVKVAMSGDGADELFGGYRKHRGHALALHTLGKLGSVLHPLVRAKQKKEAFSRENAASDRQRQLIRFVEAARLNAAERYQYWCQFTPDSVIEEALGIELSAPALHSFSKNELQDVLLYDQLQVLPYDMLTKVDLMSMRYNLEVRVPFLDPRVIAVANALPANAKYTHRSGKIILHRTFGNLLPATILARRKQGFEVPLEWLLRNGIRQRVEALRTTNFEEVGIDSIRLNHSIDRFLQGDNRLTTLIWSVVVLAAWLNQPD
jgi:asparagine synthase (glutamine-hydrolysing)